MKYIVQVKSLSSVLIAFVFFFYSGISLGSCENLVALNAREAVRMTHDFMSMTEEQKKKLFAETSHHKIFIDSSIGDFEWIGSIPVCQLNILQNMNIGKSLNLRKLEGDWKLRLLSKVENTDQWRRVQIYPALKNSDVSMAYILAKYDLTVLDANQKKGWVVEIREKDIIKLVQEPVVAEIDEAISGIYL